MRDLELCKRCEHLVIVRRRYWFNELDNLYYCKAFDVAGDKKARTMYGRRPLSGQSYTTSYGVTILPGDYDCPFIMEQTVLAQRNLYEEESNKDNG